jgi:hypothetical protein
VKIRRTSAVGGSALLAAVFVLFTPNLRAQGAPTAPPPSESAQTAKAVQQLQDQVRELRGLVDEMRAENAQSRSEMQRLRQDLQTTRALLEPRSPASDQMAAAAPPATTESANASTGEPVAVQPLEQRVQKLEDSTSLLSSKIDEQYQTKVETASKYRARLHGIVLMNAFRNVGNSNNLDFPDFSLATSSQSSAATIGASLRQSEIGFEIFGPNLAGARTSADVQFDFAGGLPNTGNATNFGIVRMQTANFRMDWEHTSVIAGQDQLFISPLSPTSFASLATPAFGFSGNLWGWTPQLRVERRFNLSDQQTFTLQAGVLDNLDWEYPPDQFFRSAQAGEQSGQPAFAVRTAWSHPVGQHPLSFGVAGYYGRQDWKWDRYVDSWAGMADWQIPLAARLSLSGEFYRGRGIGGLGGAVGRSVVFGGNPFSGTTPIQALDAIGGWSQLKLQVAPKVELNGVFAEDNTFANDVRGFATDNNNFGPILGRNRGAFGNIVFRPRSDLVLAAEFRRLRSFPIYGETNFTNQVNLSMGILF